VIRFGVIGYGYWGPNLVRNLVDLPDVQLAAVSDLNPARLAEVQRRYPNVRTAVDANELIRDPEIDAICVATPVATHFALAMGAIRAGKHVLVEKPITHDADQALQLIEEAERRRRVLMVDHTFLYTGAVRKIRDLVTDPAFGDVQYYDSVRVNLGLIQRDVSVLWDLAVHDLAILDYLVPVRPRAVSATGMRHVRGHAETLAYLTLFYENRFIAHLHVNWLSPVKIRRALIGGSNRMVVYDDLEPSEKVKVYDRGITVEDSPEGVYQTRVGYRTGDMHAPQFDMSEALRTELKDFCRCIGDGSVPLSDGHAGLRVVEILEAATRSLAECGRPIELGSTHRWADPVAPINLVARRSPA
jgi:predicted dehydrogenase